MLFVALRVDLGQGLGYNKKKKNQKPAGEERTMKAAPAAQPLLTFGQCLKQILKTRKLSASALSRMMEQKSRNSMFRILDDTGGPAVQAAFYESLKE